MSYLLLSCNYSVVYFRHFLDCPKIDVEALIVEVNNCAR